MDISLNTHAAEILVEGGRACGVRLKSGKVIRARKAVVSNATPFDTEWRQTLGTLPRHGAILHLFVAVDAEKVVDGKKLADHPRGAAEDETAKNPAHLIVQDWSRSMQDSQNLCSFFIPSLLDRSVCPEGKHAIHAYCRAASPTSPGSSSSPDARRRPPPLRRLLPGIGTPSAAASGVIAANTIVNVETHIAMLEETAKKDPMRPQPRPFQRLYRCLVSPSPPPARGSGVFQPSSGGRVSAAAEAASRLNPNAARTGG
ncbi:all-trans-retinol 13,14-reductase [Aureococcus anophagefferens]|nr:all-trans-retinol 13,14-reductase [Aureococcus anophagefferens]